LDSNKRGGTKVEFSKEEEKETVKGGGVRTNARFVQETKKRNTPKKR